MNPDRFIDVGRQTVMSAAGKLKRLIFVLAVLATACTPDTTPSETIQLAATTPGPTDGTPPRSTGAPGAAASSDRLASHLFIPVGESRPITGLGELIEVIPIDGGEPVSVDGDSISAEAVFV